MERLRQMLAGSVPPSNRLISYFGILVKISPNDYAAFYICILSSDIT